MSDLKPIKTIQWATGAIGKFNIATCHNNAAFDLVGCYVHSPEKHGLDAGIIAGVGAMNIMATNNKKDILEMTADIVQYAPLLSDVDEICQLLASGKNVITPAGFTTVSSKIDAAKLQAACTAGNSSFHGSGIHPGFSGDRLPLILSAMSKTIDKVTVYEIVDMSKVNESWDMVSMLGFDMSPQDASANPPFLLDVMSTIFFESIELVAQGLGIKIEEFEKQHKFALAKEDITVTLDLGAATGIIRKGHVAGQNFSYSGKINGKTVIDFKTYWKMAKDLEPDWPHDEPWIYKVIIDGQPPLRLDFTCGAEDGHDSPPLGLLCTAMNCMNTAPLLINAPAGIRTQLDLPMITGVNTVDCQEAS